MKKINAITFLVFVFGFFIFTLISPDKEYSSSERRNLAQFEAPTAETVMNGEWFEDFSDYTFDQFPLREEMRTINAVIRKDVYLQQDVGGLYANDGYIFKTDYPLKEENIQHFVDKTNEIYEIFVKDTADNYYVSVVPDKSYYDGLDILSTDAKEIADKFVSGLDSAIYIDIFDELSLESYYKTDTHWSQDKLFHAMEEFSKAMNFTAPKLEDYTQNILNPFYGVYHGQSALPYPPEDLIYLTNEVIDSSILFNLETKETTNVYDIENFDSKDPYNVFSDGAAALIEIESPNSNSEKELIIFRDSFGSSIAPFFLEEYRKVTLVDLRYFSTQLIEQYVDFENADVLVLYSSLILNSNIILK